LQLAFVFELSISILIVEPFEMAEQAKDPLSPPIVPAEDKASAGHTTSTTTAPTEALAAVKLNDETEKVPTVPAHTKPTAAPVGDITMAEVPATSTKPTESPAAQKAVDPPVSVPKDPVIAAPAATQELNLGDAPDPDEDDLDDLDDLDGKSL
jgi:hypothetical protein